MIPVYKDLLHNLVKEVEIDSATSLGSKQKCHLDLLISSQRTHLAVIKPLMRSWCQTEKQVHHLELVESIA